MEEISKIVDMQDELNTHTVGIDWRFKKLRWDFAISQEVMELIDSINLKWWKDTPVSIKDAAYDEVLSSTKMDILNIHIELVDILHFLISSLLTTNEKQEVVSLLSKYSNKRGVTPFSSLGSNKINILEKSLIFLKYPDVMNFFILVNACALPVDRLYKLYIGKNVLNKFRQEHGYADGTYKKLWGGVEDNVVMYDCIVKENIATDMLYATLESIYSKYAKTKRKKQE